MPLTTDERRARKLACKRRYYEKHRDAINAKRKTPEAREKNRVKAREYRAKHPWYQRNLKIKWQQAEARRAKPDRCEICGASDRRIAFDHCHQRDVFRGWICTKCNSILGFVNDNPNHLRMLIAYLERTKDFVSPQLELPV